MRIALHVLRLWVGRAEHVDNGVGTVAHGALLSARGRHQTAPEPVGVEKDNTGVYAHNRVAEEAVQCCESLNMQDEGEYKPFHRRP
jgi:hypothetical protein